MFKDGNRRIGRSAPGGGNNAMVISKTGVAYSDLPCPKKTQLVDEIMRELEEKEARESSLLDPEL